MRLIFLLQFLLFAAIVYSQNKSENDVIGLENQRLDALINNNFSFVESMLSDDFQYCRSNGNRNSKNEYLQILKSQQVIYTELKPIQINVKQYCRSLAIAREVVTISVKAYGNDGKPYQLYSTIIYSKTKRHWKIMSIQSTKIIN